MIRLTRKQYDRFLASARGNGVTHRKIRGTNGCMCFLGHAIAAKKGTRPEIKMSTSHAKAVLGLGAVEASKCCLISDRYVSGPDVSYLAEGEPEAIQAWADHLRVYGVLVVADA